MRSVFGNNLIISLFGESHSNYIGFTLHGLPSGIEIDDEFIKSELNRRRPSNKLNTSRIEEDNYNIISGVFEGFTTGSPLTVLIENKKQDSSSFEKGVCRPGQSDYTSFIASNGYNDYRSGGHLSGRLTVALVFLGAICKRILDKHNIKITSKILKKIEDKDNDTTGGLVEVKASGVIAGIGEPFFDSMESVLSHLFFSIPSVKAVEFGLGKEFANVYGSECLDEMEIKNGKVKFLNNYNGGINGGFTNGEEIVSTITFKPIASINKEVNTINILKQENIKYRNNGQNDANILNRSLVICEAMMAYGLLDEMISYLGRKNL